MRVLLVGLTMCVLGCGGSSSTEDLSSTTKDFAVGTSSGDDFSVSSTGDMKKPVTPYNMAGSVFCYTGAACSTTGSDPVCCDAPVDGGFGDTCVATSAACTAAASTAVAYECGQAADCGTGKVCCGTITTSGTSTRFAGTACATSCTTGQTQLCVTASECTTSGTSCVGKDVSGRDVGLCQ